MAFRQDIELLILRNFDGVISSNDLELLDDWRTQPKNNEVYLQYQQIWDLSSSLKDWEEFDTNSAITKLKSQTTSLGSTSFRLRFFKYAAAIILLVVSTIAVFTIKNGMSDTSNSLITSSRMFLPDNSEVALAPGAVLTTLPGFNGEERRVKLDGEAFFNITSMDDKSFIIELDESEIEVVGTAFLANSEENSVIVSEGIVILRDKENPNKQISLTAGEKASYKAEKLSQVDLNIDWLGEEIEMVDETVVSLFDELQNLFPGSLKVKLENIDNQCRITTSFNNNSILDVINELDFHFNLEYEFHQNFIQINSLTCE